MRAATARGLPPTVPIPTPPEVSSSTVSSSKPLLVRQTQWQWRSTREGRARKGRGAGRCGGLPPDVAQDLGFRARAARALLATPPPPPPCLCAIRAEMGAQLGSSVAFGSGCGQTLPGVPRKAPLCLYCQGREEQCKGVRGAHRNRGAALRAMPMCDQWRRGYRRYRNSRDERRRWCRGFL